MDGKFNDFGGQYVPETVMNALIELETAYEKVIDDKEFIEEYMYYLKYYTGRPSPLYYAENMTKDLGGAKIYLKREDMRIHIITHMKRISVDIVDRLSFFSLTDLSRLTHLTFC